MKTNTLLNRSLLVIATLSISSAAIGENLPYERTSAYVEMADGVRLAVDVYLPKSRKAGERLPALLELTRYWRAAEDPVSGEARPLNRSLDLLFLDQGYALVKVDVRGSGASFGSRPIEYGPEEVRDGFATVEWVVSQAWSNGKIGAYGVSYTGTTSELLASTGHPAIKAVIPGWSDFDAYRSPGRPYGLAATGFVRKWAYFARLLDGNDPAIGGLVSRVDGDTDGSLRAAAVKEHDKNPDVFERSRSIVFRDDRYQDAEVSWEDASSMAWRREIEASGVPMLVLASWLDAGTAGGALQRFQHFSNPQKLIILASNHGGRSHASPYTVGGEAVPPIPPIEEQQRWQLDFFDHHLKGRKNGVDHWPAIRYFNLAEEAFRESEVWPPEGVEGRRYHLAGAGRLSSEERTDDGYDTYRVDQGVTTGSFNRWATQMGEPVLHLDDRGAMDARMRVYTSLPLEDDLQITGTPVAHLQVSSNRKDGAFLVYLEDVDPDGRSRYVTEGGLRGIHRKLQKNPYFDQETPYHSYAREDAWPLVPGEKAELAFELWPTSVRVRKGHRLRIAIAGADADIFDPVPAESPGETEIRVHAASWIDLPVIGETEKSGGE